MVTEKATLVNPQGLHMRPAGLFASSMGKYACDVTVVTPEKEVNGKSPMASWLLVSPAAPRSRSSATALTRPSSGCCHRAHQERSWRVELKRVAC